MMNKFLSVILLLSMCGIVQAADMDANTALNEIGAAAAGLAACRLNSMMEAYMSGKFAPSSKEGHLTYDNHDTSAACQEDRAFEDTVKRINTDLTGIYAATSWGIDAMRPLDFHVILGKMAGKENKITYLRSLQENDKMDVQALRLYDFLQGINIDLPEDILQELMRIADDVQLSAQDKGESVQKIFEEQKKVAEVIKANRLALAKAVKAGDAAQVLEACKKPLHAAPFVSLNSAIQKMIIDIEVGERNPLLNNYSRVPMQGCIIN